MIMIAFPFLGDFAVCVWNFSQRSVLNNFKLIFFLEKIKWRLKSELERTVLVCCLFCFCSYFFLFFRLSDFFNRDSIWIDAIYLDCFYSPWWAKKTRNTLVKRVSREEVRSGEGVLSSWCYISTFPRFQELLIENLILIDVIYFKLFYSPRFRKDLKKDFRKKRGAEERCSKFVVLY